MWFALTLLTTLCWGFADLFYKKGAEKSVSFSHIRTAIAVGLVMGIHGVCYMLINKVGFDPFDMIRYFPVSFCYMLSMILGYYGLRYIELSVSSPIQNSSGAVTAILCMIFLRQLPTALQTAGIVLITAGIIAMSYIERKDNEAEIKKAEKKYVTGLTAIIFPILYCIIDGLGTFADAIYLNEDNPIMSEDSALLSYEFTFFAVAVLCFIYLTVIKKEKIRPSGEKNRLIAAIFETAGQVSYVFVIGANAVIAAPMISSYCIVSAILSAIFLKERLPKKQYVVIAAVIIGIIILGISDGLSGEF